MTCTLHCHWALSGPHLHGLGDQALGDHAHALQHARVGDELALLLVLAHLLRVGLARSADGLLLGDQHQLRAAGRARGAGGDQQRDAEGEQRLAGISCHGHPCVRNAGVSGMMPRGAGDGSALAHPGDCDVSFLPWPHAARIREARMTPAERNPGPRQRRSPQRGAGRAQAPPCCCCTAFRIRGGSGTTWRRAWSPPATASSRRTCAASATRTPRRTSALRLGHSSRDLRALLAR